MSQMCMDAPFPLIFLSGFPRWYRSGSAYTEIGVNSAKVTPEISGVLQHLKLLTTRQCKILDFRIENFKDESE